MYKEVCIKNFRGIKDLKLSNLRKINLLVGENNSGKSSILEAMFLLTGPVNPNLPLKINNWRGIRIINETNWAVLFYNFDIERKIEIKGKLDNPKENRELLISPFWSSEYTVEENEDLIKKTASGSTALKGTIQGLNLEFFLNGPKKESYRSSIKVAQGQLKVDQRDEYKTTFDGCFLSPPTIYIDLAANLEQMIVKKKNNIIIEKLRRIEPRLNDIQLGLEKSVICDIGLDKRLPLDSLGDGIKKILAILLSIGERSNYVLFIDEIENGLYPTSQRYLWEAIVETAKSSNIQFFATTHSLDCLNALVFLHKTKKDIKKEILVHRIETVENNVRSVSMDMDELATALESGWEVR